LSRTINSRTVGFFQVPEEKWDNFTKRASILQDVKYKENNVVIISEEHCYLFIPEYISEEDCREVEYYCDEAEFEKVDD